MPTVNPKPERKSPSNMRPVMANAKRATRKTSPKTTRRPMAKKKPPELAVESTGKDIYLVHNGIRIAKRGGPGTPKKKHGYL